MKNKLKKLVDQALPKILSELGFVDLAPGNVRYEIELPKVKAHGDLSVNLAFQLGRMRRRNPLEIAAACEKVLKKTVQANDSWRNWVKEITVEKPGFINFRLTEQSLASQLLDISRLDQDFGRAQIG